MEKPIFDPTIPYIGPIHGGRFRPGKMVTIQGTIPEAAYRFNINLQCGPDTIPQDDIAIQITVRILDGYTSLNSLQYGNWGELLCGTAFPIERGEEFEITLMCDVTHFKVTVDGQHYCEFSHRMHYDRITHLAIAGDVSVNQIFYESVSRDGTSKKELYDKQGPSLALNALLVGTAYPDAATGYPVVGSGADAISVPEVTNNAPSLSINTLLVDTPNPTSAPYPISASGTDAIGIVPEVTSDTPFLPPAKSDPSNAIEFDFQTVDRYYWHKCCAGFWGVFIIVIIIFVIVITQSTKDAKVVNILTDNSSSPTYESDGNNYKQY